MALLLVIGENWVRQSARSPEWWDSWVIMLWVGLSSLVWGNTCLYAPISQGIVNTFTEHHGGEWSVKDMQHTYVILLFVSHYSHAMPVYWEWSGGQAVHWAFILLVTIRHVIF